MYGADYRIISWIDENQKELPGISYQVDTQRDYGFGINGCIEERPNIKRCKC